jgi:outer membrane protein OmpA-like peptidoglycan-associated protein
MAMAVPMVMSFIGRRVREEGMTMGGLGSLLQRESATFRSALPASLCDQFWPRASTASTVVAQSVERERSSTNWLPFLALAALIPALFWIFNHGRRLATPIAPVPTGTANRIATPAPNLVCTVPTNVNIVGDEARLLAFVQNPDNKPVSNSWFTFDRLAFDTGSATLRPESQAQLNNIAAVLTNCPSVHLKIAGYTDNVGAAEPNLRLSRNRANSVMAQLVSNGVSPDHLTAEGYGQESPVADNASEEGRARNRRVAMLVTQK